MYSIFFHLKQQLCGARMAVAFFVMMKRSQRILKGRKKVAGTTCGVKPSSGAKQELGMGSTLAGSGGEYDCQSSSSSFHLGGRHCDTAARVGRS